MGEASRQRRFIGFPAVLTLIILLGSGVVAMAYTLREAESRPSISDHWHSAYGVWDCTDGEDGAFQPVFQGRQNSQGFPYDPEGIHSHSDGIIHIHPYTANAAGEDAVMGKFFESMFVTMDENAIQASEFGVISAADAVCNGEPAVIQIVRWYNALTAGVAPPDERIYEDFDKIHFKNDGEAFTLALAPRDAVVPPPPTINDLLSVSPSLTANLQQPEGPVRIEETPEGEIPGVRVEDSG